VAAVGVAAIPTLEVVGRSEDQIRTFIVEVFRAKVFFWDIRLLFCRRADIGIDWLCHRGASVSFLLLSKFSMGRCTPFPFRVFWV
jgi:hypothetical protein